VLRRTPPTSGYKPDPTAGDILGRFGVQAVHVAKLTVVGKSDFGRLLEALADKGPPAAFGSTRPMILRMTK